MEIDRRIELKFEFVREEIDIRIESIKMQLDQLYETLLNQLNEIEVKLKKYEMKKIHLYLLMNI